MIVYTQDDKEIQLTPDEAKVIRTIMRLEKMDFGRLTLFGNGQLDVRILNEDGGAWSKDSIYSTSIRCMGGDGGDNV